MTLTPNVQCWKTFIFVTDDISRALALYSCQVIRPVRQFLLNVLELQFAYFLISLSDGPFQSDILLASTAKSSHRKHLSGTPLLGRLLALPADNRLGGKAWQEQTL
jgi:hypothetical protein